MPGMEYSAGDRIGVYVVISFLGRGAMSVVYKAYDELLNRQVAIKVLSPNLLSDEDAVRRFEREAEAVSRIDHKNVAKIFAFGRTEENLPYLVMEYIDGLTFAEIIAKKIRFSLTEMVNFMLQTTEGLQAAYQQNIIHRDIKPQNLLLDNNNVLKILDFGLAKILWDETYKSVEGTIVGTPYYMSPEIAAGRPIDHRGDIYSLGATFYHILAHRPPFEADTPMGIMMKHATALPTPLYSINPNIPHTLWKIIERMLEKDPNDRYQTYDDLISELRQEEFALVNRERQAADFSDLQRIMPPVAAFLRREVTEAKKELMATAPKVPEIEAERRRRALAVDADELGKRRLPFIISLFALLIISFAVMVLLLGYYPKLGVLKKEKGNIIIRLISYVLPSSRFAEEKTTPETIEYQRGLETFRRMKTMYESILLYAGREGTYPQSLAELVEKMYVSPEAIKDGWGNNIILIAHSRHLISPGSDRQPDTDDDFVSDGDGKFIKLPEEFVQQHLERQGVLPQR